MSQVSETRSASPENSPLIGPFEQGLFEIENTRERADRLQDLLVPKLKIILEVACDLIREVYGDDVLEPCRMPTTPAHRPEGKNTKSFELASAGLAVNGQVWFFSQRFECRSDQIYVTLFGLRGLESNAIVRVLKRHSKDAVRLLKYVACEEYFSSTIEQPDEDDEDEGEKLDLATFIRKLRLVGEKEWFNTRIDTPSLELPLDNLEAAWFILYHFVALFPIFRAAANVLQGEADRFEDYTECFWDWDSRLLAEEEEPESWLAVAARVAQRLRLEKGVGENPKDIDPPGEVEESALEGGFKAVFRRHRLREKRLRKQKIREVLRNENGRLRCEVPGCGFDFLAVYGELGRDFAHVHHKNPLSDRTRPELTKLSDLAIVCANCHAMIHRGGQCRDLDGLIQLHMQH